MQNLQKNGSRDSDHLSP